jgi:DDE superfamily endonuclease
MNTSLLDIYSDYLICSFGQVTATGLSALLAGSLSHDKITRFLSEEDFTSKALWHLVKPLARKIQSEDAVLIIDDSIEEKSYTDESELICWHWDHCLNRAVKGINLLSALYYSQEVSLPVAFELIKKSEWETDKKTGKQKRVCPVSKHTYFQQMVDTAIANGLPFGYLLADTWFASAENMTYLKHDKQKDFIFPLKDNRKVALSLQDKQQGNYVSVSSLLLEADAVIEIWLERVDFPLLLCKQVFTNKDGSQGVLYLVTSDLNLNASQMQTIYQKRWKVEVYHKSLKSNASFSKSPTRTVRTQSNHFFACLWAYVKLERLRIQTKMNHFAMKAKIYLAALASAYQELQGLKASRLPA